MVSASVVIASCNTPQGHADEIPHPWKHRVDFLVNILNQYSVDVIALQEFGPLLEKQWQRHPRWSVVNGLNNNGNRPRKAMNAIAYRNDKLRVLDVKQLKFRLKGRYIYMPAVLFERQDNKATFVVIGVHVPTRRDASEFRRLAINTRLQRYAKRCRKAGHAVFIAGDRNDGHLGTWEFGFKRGVQHQVDWILSTKDTTFDNGKKIYSVYRNSSDHHAMVLVRAMFKSHEKASDNLP